MEPEPEEPTEGNAAELLERLIRDTAALGSAVAAGDAAGVLRAALAVAAAGALAVAVLAGFVLATVASVAALRSPLPGWRAPLVLAAGWLALGGLAALRLRHLRAPGARSVADAEERLRRTLEELTALVTA